MDCMVGGNPTKRIGRSRVNEMSGNAARVGVSKPGGERVSISQLWILTDQNFLILTSYF
jgi:hypothetical protein